MISCFSHIQYPLFSKKVLFSELIFVAVLELIHKVSMWDYVRLCELIRTSWMRTVALLIMAVATVRVKTIDFDMS